MDGGYEMTTLIEMSVAIGMTVLGFVSMINF